MSTTLKRLLWTINQSREFKRAAKYLRPFFPRMSLCRRRTVPRNNALALRRIALFKELLGDVNGRPVFVHSSADGLGMDVRGVPALIDMLVQWVGKKGHILMPVFTYSLGQRCLEGEPVECDAAAGPVETGIIPALFRRKQGVCCSLHPTHSVAVFGEYAGEITARHHCDIYPFGRQSPFFKLVEMRGLIIGLGVEWYRCLTSIHTAEDAMKGDYGASPYHGTTVTIPVIGSGGERHPVTTLVHDNRRYIYMNLLKLRKYLLRSGALREIGIEGVPMFIADAYTVHETAVSLACRGIVIYQ